MPNYILNRNYIHRSTSGVLTFAKGEPTFVPKHMEKEIVAIGGECVDGETPSLVPAEEALQPTPEGADRVEQIKAAFLLIVERNDSGDFTGSGCPTVKAVEKLVGFDVDRREVVGAWDEFKVTLSEGE